MTSFLSSVWRWVTKPAGLDLVEATIRIEEEFGLRISDEDAARLSTPREVVDYLMTRIEVRGTWSKDYVHESVWTILEEELGIDRKDFNDDSHFIEDMGAYGI